MKWMLLSAVLFAASFPPLEIGILAWFALAPLFICFARERPSAAACQGALWGTVVCILSGYCFPEMLGRYLGVPQWLGWPIFVLGAFLVIGLPTGVAGAWISWASSRGSGPALVAAIFSLSEHFRLASSFEIPWALTAYSQVEFSSVLALAPLWGAGGIGFIIALCNALLAGFLEPGLVGARSGRSRMIAASLLVAAYVLSLSTAPEAVSEQAGIRAAVVQGGVAYPTWGEREPAYLGLKRQLALTAQATDAGATLVVWPEYAVDLQPYAQSPLASALLAGSATPPIDLLIGGPHLVMSEIGPTSHNSVYLAHAGEWQGRYDKERLLPLTERELLGIRSWLGLPSYLPGTRAAPLRAQAGGVGVALCSEAMNPWLVRRRVLEGGEILLVPSNDSWFGAEFAQRHQLAISQLRAAEVGRFLLRPATTGISAVIAPNGRILERSQGSGPEVLIGRIRPVSSNTGWVDYGHLLWLGLLVFSSVASIFLLGEKRPS